MRSIIFWNKVNKNGPNGCWEWTAATRKSGYGAFKFDGKVYDAHRFVWNFTIKMPIPEGQIVCHKCDNRICVNPDHLYLGSYVDNAKDKNDRGRGNYAKGERVGISKLTAAKVKEIRRLREQDWSFGKLGKKYGVDKAAIRAIVLRKTWKHVE